MPNLPFRTSGEVLGIDITDSGAAMVRAVPSGKQGPMIRGSVTFPWEEEEKERLLYRKVREIGHPRTPTVSTLPMESYQLLQVQPPRVKESEMRMAVSWQIKDLIDYPLEQAVIDVFPAPEAPGLGQMVYVVAAHRETVRERVGLLERAKLRIRAVDIPEMALRNVARLEPEASSTIALLHLEQDSGLILIFKEGILYVARRMRLGLSQVLSTAEQEPDSEILEFGEGENQNLESVLLDLQRTLDYFESNFRTNPAGTLLLSPQLGDAPQLQQHLEQNLDVSVRIMDAERHLGEGLSYSEQGRLLLALGSALKGPDS